MLKYLRLTRAHTVPLEAVPALLGASLGVGTIWNKQVALWGFFGVLYHLAGYGHNSVVDWVNGYDVDDPYKQHHPLNTGALDVDTAANIVNLLLIITFVYAIVLSIHSPAAIAGIILAIICGLIYNVYGKRTEFKFLYISVAHSMVFLVPYLAVGGAADNLLIHLSFIYMFLWIVFQISVSGEIKDMGQDESNFMINLGSSVETDGCNNQDTYLDFSDYAQHYAHSIKILSSFTVLGIAAVAGAGAGLIALIFSLLIIQARVVTNLVRSGLWLREHRVKSMSIIEMMTAITFVLALSPIIGWYEALILTLGSVIWALLGNRILWGSLVAPSV